VERADRHEGGSEAVNRGLGSETEKQLVKYGRLMRGALGVRQQDAVVASESSARQASPIAASRDGTGEAGGSSRVVSVGAAHGVAAGLPTPAHPAAAGAGS
jgi:hypothetical protein